MNVQEEEEEEKEEKEEEIETFVSTQTVAVLN